METKIINRKIISLVIMAIITITMFIIFIYSYYTRDINQPTSEERKPLSLHAREIINEKRISNNILSETNKDDFSNYLFVAGAEAEFNNADIFKEGESSDIKKSREIGQNAAIVTTYQSKFKLYNATIKTNGLGSAGVYSTGTGAQAELNDTTIETSSPSSSALVASTKGTIDGNHLTIKTKAPKSPAIDSLNSLASVNVTTSLLETSGKNSPLINASGRVSVDKSNGNSSSSPIAILKDTGDVYIEESAFLAAAGSVPEGFNETGILIYGTSKDCEPQNFISVKSSLNIDKGYPFYKTASLFSISDTNVKINLTNNSLNFGSGVLAYIQNSRVSLYASGQKLTGNIIMDQTSTLDLTLKYESSYTTALNNENITLNLGINAKLILTGDTHIGKLNNEDITNSNIEFNGNHLYVGETEITKLNQ